MKVLIFAAVLSFGSTLSFADTTKGIVTEQAANEVKVGVKGMVCAFCVQGIEKRLKANKEVDSVQVSLENKFVKIKFKEGQKLSNEKIGDALKEAGYTAEFGN